MRYKATGKESSSLSPIWIDSCCKVSKRQKLLMVIGRDHQPLNSKKMREEKYQVKVPYIGGILSDNSYKFLNKATKPMVTIWKRELAQKVEELSIPKALSYEIRLFGRFPDSRRPDLSNLHKVIGDSLKKTKQWLGLGVDDKLFRFIDEGCALGFPEPELIITIIPGIREA